MPLPFLIGVFNFKGEKVKQAVKRQEKNIAKLKTKESECGAAMQALEALQEQAVGSFPEFLSRFDRIEGKPRNIAELSVVNAAMPPFDPEGIRRAAADPKWFLSQYISSTGEWMLPQDAALELDKDAEASAQNAAEAEKKLFAAFDYYEALQILAEQYAQSLASIFDIYNRHAAVLDQMYEKNRKTDWNTFGDAQKFAVQNFVQLVSLLYDMCKVKLADDDYGEGMSRIDLATAADRMKTAADYCADRGFEYNGARFDVVLKGDAGTYFSYRYRLGDRLFELLPVSEDQVEPLLEKLRLEKDVVIVRDVTQLHARALIDKLRDIDIKTQRVPSPSKTGTYYAEIIAAV